MLIVFILTKIPSMKFELGFLWLNPIGAFGVILFSLLINSIVKSKPGVTAKHNIAATTT